MVKRNPPISRFAILLILLAAIPITVFAFIRYRTYFSYGFTQLTGTKANLVVNLTDAYRFPVVPWAHLAQGGEEKTDMLASVLPQVAVLSPQYIRIDHVFDFYDVVSRNSNGQLAFNWTKLDSELRNIRIVGAKPFISVSYMPSAISSGSEIDTPRNWDEWRQCVQALIEHISGKEGLNTQNVYYEVWNEPDLFGKFTLGGKKDYLTLYKYASIGAQNAQNTNPFKFGGPATTGLYRNWATVLLRYIANNRLRLDFYSWHRYSSVISVYDDDITNLKRLMLPFPQYKDIELIISESGYNSENDKANDGKLSAIHTMALYASTFQKMDRLFHFEIKDGPGDKQYWGRWGMLTHENFGLPVAKPRYLAFQFLNRMRGDWYPVYGMGTWVRAIATTSGGIERVLVVNYDPAGRHAERVPISFVNIKNPSFTYRRIDFMGATTGRQVQITGTNWNTQETMLPNTAAIFEIAP